MRTLWSVLVVLAAVSPALAETVLLEENFEEAGAGNPGTALVNAGSGWTGSDVPYLSNYSSVDTGNCLEWRNNGGSGWKSVGHAFTNTPGASDAYTLTATLYVPNQALSNSSVWLSDNMSEAYQVGISMGQGYFNWFTYYPGGSSVIHGTATYTETDVKIVAKDGEAEFFSRSHGTDTWTSAGTLPTQCSLSTYQYVTMDVNLGKAGALDSIKLTTSPVPEPTTGTLLVLGLFGLLAYAWKKR